MSLAVLDKAHWTMAEHVLLAACNCAKHLPWRAAATIALGGTAQVGQVPEQRCIVDIQAAPAPL